MGLDVGQSRRVYSEGARRVFLVPSREGANQCIVAIDEGDGVGVVCAPSREFGTGRGFNASLIYVGKPEAASDVNVAGIANSRVRKLSLAVRGSTRTVIPTSDGGFWLALGESPLPTKIVAEDRQGREVGTLTFPGP